MDYGVTIDAVAGEFNGYVWGENIGWMTFRSTGAVDYGVTTSWVASVNDCDGDFDKDGDVDGSDLAQLAADLGLLGLSSFAAEFGRTDCLD